ncbi:beta-glucanase [Streptomyces sp. NPDC008317]|uniref:beta-glucanase n=1 Tax=Streptomyces sp. NPDC008317 TaxID=3364827 RepID=UPI0036F14FD5
MTTGQDAAQPPPQQPTPHDPPQAPPHGPPPPRRPRRVVFDAPFTDRTAWAAGRTSAYPESGRNPGDNKLDQIGPAYAPTAGGVFRARRAPGGVWHTDLVSTEYAPGGFELLPGDELTATCVVHAPQGAWPAIWTWGRDSDAGRPQPGHGEIDLFEYHPTNPRLLELSNHVRPGGFEAADVIAPGRPFALRVRFDADDVCWSIDDEVVFRDGHGVGPAWRAWPVVNISVSAGAYGHTPPDARTSLLHWECAGLTVTR